MPATTTISISQTGSQDIGASAYIIRGLTSITPSAVATLQDTADATPLEVTVSPGEQSSIFAFWFDEQNETFSTFTAGLTQANFDNGHVDANGYATGQAAGTYTPGVNLSGASAVRLSDGRLPTGVRRRSHLQSRLDPEPDAHLW